MNEEVTSAAGAPASAPPPEAPAAPVSAPLTLDSIGDRVAAALTQAPAAPPPVAAPAAPAPAVTDPTAPAAVPEAPTAEPVEEEFTPDKLAEITDQQLQPPPPGEPVVAEPLEDDPTILAAIEGSPKLKLAWNEYKKSEQVVKEIGHVPTLEQQRQYYDSYLAMETMREHFTSEDPAVRANWINSFFGAVDQQGQPKHPEAVAAANEVLRMQPQILARANPVAFKEQAEIYGRVWCENLYARAAREQDPNAAAHLLDTARALDFQLTGKYRLTAAEQAEQARRQPSPEEIELQRRTAALEHERRRDAENRRAASDAAVQQNLARVTEAQNSQMDKDVRAALGKVLEGLEPDYQNYLVEQFKTRIRADVDRDQNRKRIVLNHGKELAKAGAMNRMTDYLREYRTLYVTPLVTHTNQFRREAAARRGANVQRQLPSPERAAQLQASAQNLNPGGAPAKPGDPVIGQIRAKDRQPGEPLDAFIDRAARASLSVAG